ncbi:restriction endonuclease subunit S [Mycobacterium sp. E136]|uniref:restriction endonuclease subunit S n=1 Tax=Mycobacterium sp. E136 TaxID=1834125 RepID=UPI000A015F12|nr:restriction endonuclease subunit S [Mycobacterium sp. E136]
MNGSEWRDVKLAELGQFSSGKPITPGLEGLYKAFGANGVIGGADVARHHHGLIIGRVGAYCGSVAVSYEPFWASDNTIVIEPHDTGDLDYLYYLLRDANLNRHAGGAAQPLVTQGALKALTFRVPDSATRLRIGKVLRMFDRLIETAQRRIAVLEDMVRAIYREWFIDFRFPGHLNTSVVDSSLGRAPESWTWSTCGDELNFIGGGTPSKKVPEYWDGGTIAWYTPSDLTKNRWRYSAEPELQITEMGVAKSSARRFPAGSVLMTSRATLGVLAIATTEATTNQGFIVVLPDDRWSPGFMREWLDAQAQELAAIATGATFKEITKGAFKRVRFLVPKQTVLDAYATATEPLEMEILNLERQVRCLSTMRDLLQPKLVTGQVDVSALDFDAMLEGAVT